MAIVEATKYPHSECSKTTIAENTQAVSLTADTIISNGKSDLRNDNGNSYSGCILDVRTDKSVESHAESVPQSPNVKKLDTVTDCDITFQASSMSNTEILKNNAQVDENSSRYKPNISALQQFIVRTSKTMLSNADSTPRMESNAEVAEMDKGLNSDPNNLDISPAQGNNTVLQSDRRSLFRKKLYSGRDSPVDLIRMRRSSVNHINKPKKSLHPALDPTITATRKFSLLQKRKIIERKRQKWSELISKKLARTSSNSQESQDDNQTLSSVSDTKEIIRRSERLRDTDRKQSVLSKYNELSDSDEDEAEKENLVSSSNVSSSNGAANITNLKSTEDAETVKNILTNRQKEKIAAKYVEIGTKYPVVRLERISPSKIKKPMLNGSTAEQTVSPRLRNTIQLNRSSVTNIQPQRKSVRSKNSSWPSGKTFNSKLLVTCQVQNIDGEDFDTTQSAVSLSECKTPEQELANELRRGIPRSSFRKQGTNELSKEVNASVVLERIPQEELCNIRRYTRNWSNEEKKSKIRDSTLKKPASIDTSTAQLTNDTSKTDVRKRAWRVETHVYHSEKFERKRTVSPTIRAASDVRELRRTNDNKRYRAIAYVSSDEEAEFIKLLQNSRSTKRQRTENEIKLSNVAVVNIVDTTDGESDVFVNDDNPKTSLEVRSTARKAKRSTSRRNTSRSRIALRRKALERSITLGKYASSGSQVSGGILTPTRVNRKAISLDAIGTRETSSSPVMVDKRISTTFRTPKKNNASLKESSGEAPNKFEQNKRISKEMVRDSVTPRMPATRLRFQTRLYNSDSE